MLPSRQYPEDGMYRYGLSRKWGPSKSALWLLANPSTADRDIDDRTVYEVSRFTDELVGLQSLIVMNLYPRRATKAECLRDQERLVADADKHIKQAVAEAHVCIVGWGGCLANVHHRDTPFSKRVKEVVRLLSALTPLFCLGPEEACGPQPWHPLHAARQPGIGRTQDLREWSLDC
jgi:hypothetical protein